MSDAHGDACTAALLASTQWQLEHLSLQPPSQAAGILLGADEKEPKSCPYPAHRDLQKAVVYEDRYLTEESMLRRLLENVRLCVGCGRRAETDRICDRCIHRTSVGEVMHRTNCSLLECPRCKAAAEVVGLGPKGVGCPACFTAEEREGVQLKDLRMRSQPLSLLERELRKPGSQRLLAVNARGNHTEGRYRVDVAAFETASALGPRQPLLPAGHCLPCFMMQLMGHTMRGGSGALTMGTDGNTTLQVRAKPQERKAIKPAELFKGGGD